VVGLWSCRNVAAFADDTLLDGRVHLQFGDEQYGCMPEEGEEVVIRYALTLGAAGNRAQVGASVTVAGHPGVTGKPGSVSNGVRTFKPPSGGTDQRSPESYALGSYGAAPAGAFANKIQYNTIVNEYPGVVDAIVLAQRELDVTDPRLMNTLWVGAITNTPWGEDQKQAYCRSIMDAVYGPQVCWREPTPVPINISLSVHCHHSASSASAVEEIVRDRLVRLFAEKRGVLQKPFYAADLSFPHKHVQRVEVVADNYLPGKFEYCVLGEVSVKVHMAEGNFGGYA
jgi:hypothetical protein